MKIPHLLRYLDSNAKQLSPGCPHQEQGQRLQPQTQPSETTFLVTPADTLSTISWASTGEGSASQLARASPHSQLHVKAGTAKGLEGKHNGIR